jgi:type I restriction enzyme, S subunit
VSDLPQGWAVAHIPEMLANEGLFSDGDWVESKDQDPEGDVRLIQLADVGDGSYRDRSARFLTSSKAQELGCTFLQPEDVLIARMPDPLGRACLFPGDSKASVTVVDVCVVRPGSGGVSPRWLMYTVNAPQARRAMVAFEMGTTRKRISRRNLARIPLPVPPLAEQHRIVDAVDEEFSRLDAGVAVLERARQNLKRMRLAVLEKLGTLPQSDPMPLSALVHDVRTGLDRGRAKQRSGPPGHGYIKMGDVRDGSIDLTNLAFVDATEDEIDRYGVIGGDVLFNNRNSHELVGKSGIVLSPQSGTLYNNNLVRLRAGNRILPEFLAFQMWAPIVTRQLDRMKSSTTNVAAIYTRDLMKLTLLVPPIDIQGAAIAWAKEALSHIDHVTELVTVSTRRNQAMRSSTLAAAFSGKLARQVPSDEPASALLGRIAAERSELNGHKTPQVRPPRTNRPKVLA